jgi:hypothetical protein
MSDCTALFTLANPIAEMNREVAGVSLPWKRLIAELAVIVAGVLIALGADSWWEQRQERRRAEEYLQQLLVDFQKTERGLRSAIAGDTKTFESASRVIDRAYRGRFPPTDSLELPTGYHFFLPQTGTLTAVVQGGDLRLLDSDTLRFELVAYSSLIDDIETVLRHSETMIWNSTERVILSRARHSHSAVRRAANDGSGWGQVDVAGALNDPEIISALQVQAMASQIRLFNLRRLEKPTGRVIRLIQAELGDQ